MTTDNNLFSRFAENWDDDALFLTTEQATSYAYRDLKRISGQVAATLLDLGLNVGDRVSVQADKSVDYLWLFLGCLRGGFVFHPLNPAYTKSELEYFFSDAEPGLVICDPDNPSSAAEVARNLGIAHCLTMSRSGAGTFRDSYTNTVPTNEIAVTKPDDYAALLYSSGTTGQPKGIPLTQRNIIVNALELTVAWGFSRDDVLLHALPMFHTHGLFIALNCTLMSGSAVRYLQKFDADTVIDHLADATVMMGVPTYYTRLLGNPRLSEQVTQSIRLFTSGSAPLREDTFHDFERRTGHTILERYGMTETIILTTNPLVGERKATTVGLPLPSVELRIADELDAPLTVGEVGKIQVRGPSIFGEYWRKPEKTAEDFTEDGYFDTGDQGRIDEQGYVAIVGRAKDLVISGGLNVYPIEVEVVLNDCDGIVESAVIGVPHHDFGEVVVAIVTLEANFTFDEAAARDFVRERLANFKIPKRVVAVDVLPRNAMGKVQKNVLREQYRSISI